MQILALVLFFGALLFTGTLPPGGLLDLPVWGTALAGLVMTHITIVCVTVFLHRHQAHRALELHPAVSHFFRFWLWLTTGMVTREWVSVHRKHHAKCETAEDPHSPRVFGIGKVLWSGAELYTAQAENPDNLRQYGRGTPEDWVERHLYSRFTHLGLAIMMGTDFLLFGALGLTVWAVQMAWIPFWAAGVVNGLGHYLGYRNFETRDASTNLVPWGILIGGEELHNNHHAYPSSARLSNASWEFDIGWFYIRTMELLGLARVKKLAARPVFRWNQAFVDGETVLAVMQNRVHVMALYARQVALPVLRQELAQADQATRRVLKGLKPYMIREYPKLDEMSMRALSEAFKSHHALETVHRFREQLRELWSNASLSGENRLEALRLWCADAEASSIEVLRNFSQVLRAYSLVPGTLVPSSQAVGA